MWHALLNRLAPLDCAACGARCAARALFCRSCADTVLRATALGRLDATAGAVPVWAPFYYGGAMQLALTRWKYQDVLGIGTRLAPLLAQELQARGPREWLRRLPVPLPSHPQRLAERGFHPPSVLAAALRAASAPPPMQRLLRARHATAHQANLGASARARNVHAQFEADPDVLRPRPLLLVDDVLTTGATARAACDALHAAGFDDLAVLVLARSHPPSI